MPSTGAKKAVVCPSEEQFVNGGFETGDFTGWTKTGNANRWEVATQGFDYDYTVGAPPGGYMTPAEGTYLAKFHSIPGDPELEFITGTLEQIFAKQIPTSCFTDSSIFQVKTSYTGPGCPNPPLNVWQVEILYTDGTSTVVDMSGDLGNEWTTHDLKAVLEPGKTVKGIKFTVKMYGWVSIGNPAQEAYIDACTCFV